MKVFENETFQGFYDRDSATVFSDMEFRRCHFLSAAISITLNPKLRSTVRNVNLIKCEATKGSLWSAVVEDVTVDGLKTHRLLQSWGAVFKHLVIKGKVGRVMFSQSVYPGKATKVQQQAFDDANSAFYRDVDWSMDISKAEFEECEIQCVPARLIRRDPETQVVVTRAKALQGEWRRLNLAKTHWAKSLDLFVKRGDQDVVLVAPKRNRKVRDLLAGLNVLRDAGIAEPN